MQISKYFKFIAPTILFFIVLDTFFRSSGLSLNSLLILFIVSALSSFRITEYKFLPVLLSFISSTGIVLFLITLGEKNLQYTYMAFSSLLFLFSLVGMYKFFSKESDSGKTNEAKIRILDSGFNFNQSIIIVSLFLFSSGVYGIYSDLGLPTWMVMAAVFMYVLACTYYLIEINFMKSKKLGLRLDVAKNKTFGFYSFLLALLAAELVWSLSFWPSNQLTIGSVMLISYYSAWNILKRYLRNELTRTILFHNLLFYAIFTILVVSTSKWDILATI